MGIRRKQPFRRPVRPAARVIAPIAGVVIEREPAKRLGQVVNRGDKLVALAQTSGLHVKAAVPAGFNARRVRVAWRPPRWKPEEQGWGHRAMSRPLEKIA